MQSRDSERNSNVLSSKRRLQLRSKEPRWNSQFRIRIGGIREESRGGTQ